MGGELENGQKLPGASDVLRRSHKASRSKLLPVSDHLLALHNPRQSIINMSIDAFRMLSSFCQFHMRRKQSQDDLLGVTQAALTSRQLAQQLVAARPKQYHGSVVPLLTGILGAGPGHPLRPLDVTDPRFLVLQACCRLHHNVQQRQLNLRVASVSEIKQRHRGFNHVGVMIWVHLLRTRSLHHPEQQRYHTLHQRSHLFEIHGLRLQSCLPGPKLRLLPAFRRSCAHTGGI
mmetsp:Transcript_33150/g.74141  ORF Transcript_33150/g.74141 Transcript_33150/m.74141 type:complete len:232 (-) Transcript_33150:786-1481(-)